MDLRTFSAITILVLFIVSCGETISTKGKPKSDNDSNISSGDNDSFNDDSTSDDSIISDDETKIDSEQPDEDIPEGCGNKSIEGSEICDGGTINCVDLNSILYIGGLAQCRKDCTGWDPETCEISEENECTSGQKQCYGATQYQVCGDYNSDDITEWGDPVSCSKGNCTGNGECLADCLTHYSYSCYNDHVYWFDSCGQMEDLKQSCGSSGYTGNNYCSSGDVYQDYTTRSCNYDDCSEQSDPYLQEECSNGCSSGTCNAEGYCGDSITNGTEICDGNSTTCLIVLGSSYTGTAYCNEDCDGWDTSSCTSSTLAAPLNVAASDGSYTGYIYISWSSVASAQYYFVYRATTYNGTYSLISSSSGITTTYFYDDYPPAKSTYYYYKVKAYNTTSGYSAYSNYNEGYCL